MKLELHVQCGDTWAETKMQALQNYSAEKT